MGLRPKEDAARPTGWTEMEAWDENHCTWDMENIRIELLYVGGQSGMLLVVNNGHTPMPSPDSNHSDTLL